MFRAGSDTAGGESLRDGVGVVRHSEGVWYTERLKDGRIRFSAICTSDVLKRAPSPKDLTPVIPSKVSQ